ncbi:hypothetical protein [Amycolatopsis solani]|uniref:hypothetical protein n=1 Tax=Amycolatopsis solani TaxID=3028615 RepID=UPI0025B2455D|nr:hypothetical protein [Amycolatopsis sp. MEP2-6]
MIEQHETVAGKNLYPAERLARMTTTDLTNVFRFAGADAEPAVTLTYAGMNRAETIATAHQTQQAIVGELHQRALLDNVARGMTDAQLAASIKILDSDDYKALSDATARGLDALRAEQERRTAKARTEITDTSLRLFLAFARDAGNWSGTPMVGGNVEIGKEGRGNLTQLKKAGLITTFRWEGDAWVDFTDAGVALAAEHGITVNR